MTKYDISDFPQILLLDTNDRAVTRAAVITHKHVSVIEQEARAQDILSLVESALSESAVELKQIKIIGVVQRDGSLTGQRIGVAVANTLAWTLGVPILEHPETDLRILATKVSQGEKFAIAKVARTN